MCVTDISAPKTTAGPVIENTAFPFIRATFGDDIDVTGRETTVGHVKRRKLNGKLLDSVIRERHAGGS